jgi:hypothetical protein
MPDETELVASRLPKELVAFVLKLGRGNKSEGIRMAIEYVMREGNAKPTQAQINDAIRTLAAAAEEEATP